MSPRRLSGRVLAALSGLRRDRGAWLRVEPHPFGRQHTLSRPSCCGFRVHGRPLILFGSTNKLGSTKRIVSFMVYT